jgi:membrane protease YdiL (CAAX protease family)
MATTPAESELQLNPERKLIAPLWHTIVFLLFLIGYAYFQRGRVGRFENQHITNKVPFYLLTIVFELVLVAYVWFLGVRPAGGSLRAVIGGKWNTAGDVLRDIGVAFVFWIIIIGPLVEVQHLLGANSQMAKAARVMSPQSTQEMIAWACLSVSAGFCEELVFRGYLQKQFHAFTGSAALAILLQAVVFGAAHSYQGVNGAVTITVYGALFGILAEYRKSLRPGMIQHATQDTFAGLAYGLLQRLGKLPRAYF